MNIKCIFKMALFPAYAGDSLEGVVDDFINNIEVAENVVSPATETRLLASDSGDERCEPAEPSIPSALPPAPPPPDCDFYIDTKLDAGNFRVSTLYYPGRPEYNRAGGMVCKKSASEQRRVRRYYQRPAAAAAPSAEEMVTALRRALRGACMVGCALPLWERYAELRPEEALREAEKARAARPSCPLALSALLAVARRQDSHTQHLRRLHSYIIQEKQFGLRCRLWERVVECAALAGEGEDAVAGAAAAALRDLSRHPPAYPHIFYTYGAYLRAAGLWEKLVLLMELFAAMNFPPGSFPPAVAPAVEAEAALVEREEQLVRSSLPLGTVWVRAERARAAVHWRPAPASALASQLDPQRAPLPADVAELLAPVVDAPRRFLLGVHLLRLAKVPLLPGAGHVVGCAALLGGATDAAEGAEALLPLLRAARRLPAAHPARPCAASARKLLAAVLDPPHYFTDDHGYLTWVNALWECCCAMESGAGGAGERRRVALLCWRLRWLHALLLLAEPAEEGGAAEARRIRAEAREALRVHAGDSPLPYAQFARIEAAAEGEEAGRRGARVALRALRAALAAPDPTEPHTALYLARVVCELSGAESPAGRWAMCSAVLRRQLPDEHVAELPPTPTELLLLAAQTCEERCAEVERSLDAEGEADAEVEEGEEVVRALLPGECEWARARVLLATPRRRIELLRAALAGGAGGERAARYREAEAAALCASAGRGRDRGDLAAMHPQNAYLAIMSSTAPLWCCVGAGGVGGGRSLAGRWEGSATRALAALLPLLLHQIQHTDDMHGSERCVRVCRRVCGGGGGGGGALLAALWLRCEALAPRPRAQQALLAALDAHPQHKWLYVRGAEGGGDARELADLLLERALRLHVLPDELLPHST